MCPSQTYNNAIWPSSTYGNTVNGTCIANYAGSPTRQCTQNVTSGVWSPNVTNPCTGIVILLESIMNFLRFTC